MPNKQEQDLENQNENDETLNSQTQDSSQDTDFSEEQAVSGDKIALELQETKDKFVRLFAEFENFRRRTAKESFELTANANAKLLGKLTEVLDNFNLAFDPKHKAASQEDVDKGIRLIYNKFKDILSDEGLTEIDPAGEEFDPNLHDAVMQQPSDTVPGAAKGIQGQEQDPEACEGHRFDGETLKRRFGTNGKEKFLKGNNHG
jgi:molecular chaperone GrpE